MVILCPLYSMRFSEFQSSFPALRLFKDILSLYVILVVHYPILSRLFDDLSVAAWILRLGDQHSSCSTLQSPTNFNNIMVFHLAAFQM